MQLKGHLRALPTEIISPAKWRSNRKWRPTNGPADRLGTKFPKISSFWWVLQWAAATTWAGQHEPSSFSPQHRKHRSFSFFSSSLKLMDDWPPRSTSRLYPAYGGLWYFAERGKLLPWCRSDNMPLDNGGWRDDAPISSPSLSIWISCAVKASDRTN